MSGPSRADRLNSLFNAVVHKNRDVGSQAAMFIEAICAQKDAAKCIGDIVNKDKLVVLRNAVCSDASATYLNGSVQPFLSFMQHPTLKDLSGGLYLRKVMQSLAEGRLLLLPFTEAFEGKELSSAAEAMYAWFVLQLLLLPNGAEDHGTFVKERHGLLQLLSASSDSIVQNHATHIKTLLSTTIAAASSSTNDSSYQPGGRHDNDKENFREISILPTPSEIQYQGQSFYRRSTEIDDASPGDREGIYLDNQFRLYREDMMYELREEMAKIVTQKKKRPNRRVMVIDNVTLTGVYGGDEKRKTPMCLTFQCSKDLPQLSGQDTPQKRTRFWESDSVGKKMLRHQTLFCIVVDDQIISFGTLHRVEALLSQSLPIIVLQVSDTGMLQRTLQHLKHATNVQLVQIDTGIFAYEPVLRTLQAMHSLPLCEELLMWDAGVSTAAPTLQLPPSLHEAISVIQRHPTTNIAPYIDAQQAIQLDRAQASSLVAGLTQTVSLIQGPPGTGKSFIGALLAKFIHKHTSDKILVVCFTNHALDQFLEDLIKIGIPDTDIVRIGGGKSASATEHLGLRKQTRVSYLSSGDRKTLDSLRADEQMHWQSVENSFQSYQSSTVTLEHILAHIEFEDYEFFQAFTVPQSQDEMQLVGKKGKNVTETYLLNQWRDGKDAGVFRSHAVASNFPAVWSMKPNARRAKYDSWKDELVQYTIHDVASTTATYNTTVAERQQILGQSDIAIIEGKRIIGCTTTGAAKYKDQIQSSQPEVLLVEEAGEILESHVVTALGVDMKQLILIGDHKQLRPKVNHYTLTVEKGEGYDLNRSLFERLVHRDFPHETLVAQHRMRPEIADMIRHLKTYDTLNDAPRTANRPNLRGVRGNVVFIDHTSPEDDDKQLADRRDMGSTTSKQNTFEVQMAFRIVRYIIQQGYKMEDIVVLTPYLGQLQKLRKTFESDAEPLLNDQDLSELVRAGVLGTASSSGKPKLRMATIDNYQGEESNIVVVSLCRSNNNNDIGFMYSAERLNVLLSRARNSLIMIGNSHTFTHSRKGAEVWTPLLEHIREKGYLYDGFPTECVQHPTSRFLLKSPLDFDAHCPDGGCDRPCGKPLSCGKHQCPLKCHMERTAHADQPCQHVIEEHCPANHSTKRKCSDPVSECKTCLRVAREEEKRLQREMEAEKKREAQKEAHERRMQELADKIAQAQQERQDDELEKQRAIALQNREEELKNAREMAQNSKKETKNFLASLFTWSSSASSSQPPAQPPSSASSQPNPTTVTGAATPPNPTTATAATLPNPVLQPVIPIIANTTTANKSPAEAEWQRQKDVEGANSPPIDAIMELIGLEDVKLQILRIKDKVEVAESQGTSLADERFNIVLLGNPGTGKTTIARQYAKFLTSKRIVSGYAFIEITGSLLAHQGVAGAEKVVKDALNAGGGAIFIDEAYQLVISGKDTGGSQVLDYLLAEMENRVGKIVFILAGYRKQMEKFFEHNPGLRSRVPYTLQFADYTDAELQRMLTSLIRKKYQNKMQVEDGIEGLYTRVAIRRLGRGRGREGFGNARDLQNMFAKISERQAARIKQEQRSGWIGVDAFLLTKEDFIGPDPAQAIHKSSAWTELHALIGLQSVKDSVQNLFDLVLANYHRELEEKEPLMVTLNRVFLGSPGTGKTSVGKLYGQILADIGMLSNGEVIVKNPSDFTGAYIGHSEKQTKAILDSSIGKVLIIDEAYMLYGGGKGSSHSGSNNFQTAVIDTIVAEVQNVPGDDRCVLLLGYEKEMKEMFQNVNPGLSRRFAIEDAFRFEDFTDSELGRILDLKLAKQDLEVSDHAKKVALELLARERTRPNFGNGGAVENLLSQAKNRYMARIRGSIPPTTIVFAPEDFDPEFERHLHASQRLKDLFKDVVGCEDVIRKLEEYQTISRNMKERNEDPSTVIPTNFLFKGPPGTGKTTVARKLGHIYYDMGFLAKPEVHECSATDLVGQYVGQTGPKTSALFEKALGQVLFIDEAYRLGEGRFAQEAVDEMVGLLTQERFKGKIIVILAGYDQDINRLLTVNAGLASRFPEVVPFSHFSPLTCLEILRRKLEQGKVILSALSDSTRAQYRCLLEVQEELVTLSSWGNARDMETLAKQMIGKALKNAVSPHMSLSISTRDALDIMLEMLNKNRERSNLPPLSRSRFETGLPEASVSSTSSPPPPPPSQATAGTQRPAQAPPPSQGPADTQRPAQPPLTNPPKLQSSSHQSSRRNLVSPPPQPPSSSQNQANVKRRESNGPGSLTENRQQHSPAPPQSPGTSNSERDPGVTDDVWNRLQQDRRREEGFARRKELEIQQAEEQRRKAEQEHEQKTRELNAARQALRRVRDAAEREAAKKKRDEAEKKEKEAREAQKRAIEAARQKREVEERRKEREKQVQSKLREIGRCPQGYEWVKNPAGYRCRGGSHFVNNNQLPRI